ncbi:hypothetical protein DYBT9275_05103 [Dyadobacter sp. CECT 9275]|uniref:Gliding motility-associated C-terminal domain-containing protein n=1 Tax=Dyadobacter helix TaxID=2822344 RepID=A0A916JHX8_9BACT|nr:hypothetical protein DYBT9275_05103 [Dyadobacter sp. CECT 9275]
MTLSGKLAAQGLCSNPGGSFHLDVSEGCAPVTITITNDVPNEIDVGYLINYDGSSTQNLSFTDRLKNYTYYGAGVYTVLQKAVTASGQFYACQKVTVYESRNVNTQFTSCGGGKIKISLTNDVILNAYDQLDINWGDGETMTWKRGDNLRLEHIYTPTSVSPTVKIRGIYTGNKACAGGSVLSIPVSFQQTQLNSILLKSLVMKGKGTLEVNYSGINSVQTKIQYRSGNGSFETAGSRSGGGSQFYRIDNLNTAAVYQLKLSSQDLCGEMLDSPSVTSMRITGSSENEENLLEWNRYPEAGDFEEYQLYRDGFLLGTFTDINENNYVDKAVQCGDSYEYYVVTRLKGATSTSAFVTVKTKTTQARPIEEAYVTTQGEKSILIKAVIPGGQNNYELTLEKSEAGSDFKKLTTLFAQNEYEDLDVSTSATAYCYRFIYQNSCGQKLPATSPVCTILLTNELSTFRWNNESPFLNGVKGYQVLQRGSVRGEELINLEMAAHYTPGFTSQSDPEYTFQIMANATDGKFQSFSNILSYKRNPDVFIPSAFSPDGDGYNDVLEAKVTQVRSFSLSVLNRWGTVVFHSDDIGTGWDGKVNGANAPEGSYIYKLVLVDDINQTIEKSGTFMLLR